MHNIETPDLPETVKDVLFEFAATEEGAREIQALKGEMIEEEETRRSKMRTGSR